MTVPYNDFKDVLPPIHETVSGQRARSICSRIGYLGKLPSVGKCVTVWTNPRWYWADEARGQEPKQIDLVHDAKGYYFV